jgi:hypothetical protein
MYTPFFKVQRPLEIPTQIPDEPLTNYLLNFLYEPQIKPNYLGHLVLVQSLPTSHTSHQSLEQIHTLIEIFWRIPTS